MAANASWAGQPERCTCRRMVVATIEETLDCPAGWRYAPGIGWLHPFPPKWTPR